MTLLRFLASAPTRAPSWRGTYRFISNLPSRSPARPVFFANSFYKRGRDAFVISNVLKHVPLRRHISKPLSLPPVVPMFNTVSNFGLYGDNRTFHPAGRRRPLLVSSPGAASWTAPSQPEWERQADILRRHAEKAKRANEPGFNPFRRYDSVEDTLRSLRFQSPGKVVICAKRKIRREILHAIGVAGLVGVFKKPVRNLESAVRC